MINKFSITRWGIIIPNDQPTLVTQKGGTTEGRLPSNLTPKWESPEFRGESTK